MGTNIWKEGSKKMEPRLFQGCPLTGQESIGNNWNTSSKHEEKFFHCEDNWLQFAQTGCGVYTLRDTQKLPGHGPGQVPLGDPTWGDNTMPCITCFYYKHCNLMIDFSCYNKLHKVMKIKLEMLTKGFHWFSSDLAQGSIIRKKMQKNHNIFN